MVQTPFSALLPEPVVAVVVWELSQTERVLLTAVLLPRIKSTFSSVHLTGYNLYTVQVPVVDAMLICCSQGAILQEVVPFSTSFRQVLRLGTVLRGQDHRDPVEEFGCQQRRLQDASTSARLHCAPACAWLLFTWCAPAPGLRETRLGSRDSDHQ
jgi:hypothetical protein